MERGGLPTFLIQTTQFPCILAAADTGSGHADQSAHAFGSHYNTWLAGPSTGLCEATHDSERFERDSPACVTELSYQNANSPRRELHRATQFDPRSQPGTMARPSELGGAAYKGPGSLLPIQRCFAWVLPARSETKAARCGTIGALTPFLALDTHGRLCRVCVQTDCDGSALSVPSCRIAQPT